MPGASSGRPSAATKGMRSRSASAADARLGAVADAALGHVDDAPQVDRVAGVGEHPQVGQGVLDLAPLVEPGAADHLVGQADPHEHLFERSGLGVGAVEHRDVARTHAVVVAEPVDRPGHERRLVVLVVADVADDARAVTGLAPQVLLAPALVAGDDRVGGAQDGLGGAVVLLEQDGAGVGVVLLELLDVADGGPAEGVDRLVCVTDHDELARLDAVLAAGLGPADELAHQLVLGVVGVLVLVDHDVPEPAPVVLGDVGEGLEHVHRGHDQVVEVHGVGLAQPPLVGRVGLGEHLLLVRAGLAHPARVGLLVDQLVLEVAHLVAERAWVVSLGVEVHVADDHRHQPLAVGGVVDREGRAQPHLVGLAAQDAHARAVEGHHPHRLGAGADERGDPLAHLGGGLVGEGDGEHLAGLHAAGGEQVGDAVGEHAGLARPCAGDDEQGAALVQHGLALLRVEADEQLLRVGARTARGRTALGAQPGGGGLRPGRHPHGVDQRRVGAGVGGGVHVRLVARVAEVEAVEEGAHVGVNPTWSRRPRPSTAPRAPGCGARAQP